MHPLTTRGVLCCAQVGDDGLRALTELRHTLTTLTLKGCERITDDGLEMLAQCPHLTALDVSGCAEVRPLTPSKVASPGPKSHLAASLRACVVYSNSVIQLNARDAQHQQGAS